MYTYYATQYDPTEYIRSLSLLKAGENEDDDGPEEESQDNKVCYSFHFFSIYLP